MKRLVILMCASLSLAGADAWTSLGPAGGGARTLVIDPLHPDTIYAGTLAGIFKSTDAGATWNPAGPLPAGFDFSILLLDPRNPDTLYAGSYGGDGVFKSSDGGATWKTANSGLAALSNVTLAIDPQNSSTVYAAGNYGGVYKTTNGEQPGTP